MKLVFPDFVLPEYIVGCNNKIMALIIVHSPCYFQFKTLLQAIEMDERFHIYNVVNSLFVAPLKVRIPS